MDLAHVGAGAIATGEELAARGARTLARTAEPVRPVGPTLAPAPVPSDLPRGVTDLVVGKFIFRTGLDLIAVEREQHRRLLDVFA